MAVDELARRVKADPFRDKFSGEWARAEIAGEPAILLKPQTYMNESGRSVQPALAFFKIAPAEVVVLHDELDIPFGEVRLKHGGGHAGHNGLRSIMASTSGDFGRLRLGIGRPPPGFRGEVADFVLSSFDAVERAALPDLLKKAGDSVLDIARRGFGPAMNARNTRPRPPKPPKPPVDEAVPPARADRERGAGQQRSVRGQRAIFPRALARRKCPSGVLLGLRRSSEGTVHRPGGQNAVGPAQAACVAARIAVRPPPPGAQACLRANPSSLPALSGSLRPRGARMSRATTAPNRAREYETIYVLRPDIDADGADKIGTRLAEVVARESGRLTKVESWGRRRLAYDIGKQRRGVYMYLKYLGGGKVVSEIERNLRLSDGVIKYQTVLVRSDVEAAGLTVADEDVKFERLELPPAEDDRDDSRERQLGLIEPERRQDRAEVVPDDDDVEPGAAPEEEEET